MAIIPSTGCVTNKVEERTWEEFIDSKLLWWVNRSLHLFGWCPNYLTPLGVLQQRLCLSIYASFQLLMPIEPTTFCTKATLQIGKTAPYQNGTPNLRSKL